jgi:hypothetical protein
MKTDVDLPFRMRGLPVNKVGYVVPWFVAWIDGAPDFRIIKPDAISDALRFKMCWLCGQTLGRYVTFVIGSMCVVNRVSAEPGCHEECAEYAVKVCPFLSRPAMVRRPVDDVVETAAAAGIMIDRNPGVAVTWTSTTWKPFRAANGVLIDVGEPDHMQWWAHGRQATRVEVEQSVDTGLPTLRQMAEKQGPDAVAALEEQHQRAIRLFPGEAA